MTTRTRFAGIFLLSLLGIADSWYLAQHAVEGTALSCGIDGVLSGCNAVAQSPYSHFFGIPLGVYGVAFYAAVLLLAAIANRALIKEARRAVALLSAIGMLASLYFIGLQVFVIDALCIYCIGSFVVATGIFLLALPLWRRVPASVPPTT